MRLKMLVGFCITAIGGFSSIANAQDNSTNVVTDTCTGIYPSYWQDPDPKFSEQWAGETISNVPTKFYQGPVFRLSDAYPQKPVDDKAHQAWRSPKFDKMFDPKTDIKTKLKLANEYAMLVFKYSLEGNINQPGKVDYDVCTNPVRPWYHMPFQTYDAGSGREFIRGLTREAPVTFSIKGGEGTTSTTMWAVAIFNQTAAYTIGSVWQKDGTAKIPTENIVFHEGSVVAKPLFNTATPDQIPVLTNMPAWKANISDPSYCQCVASSGSTCTQAEESNQCKRTDVKWPDVRLMQYDFAVRDSRATKTGWVFGTYVADGLRKAKEPNPWMRLSLLGVMWGNDTPPQGGFAANYPPDPRKNGFKEAAINWDVVDDLNRTAGTGTMFRPGHLGSNNRLNGPADNANSSCLSCHGTASVPDSKINTPPLLTQFAGNTLTFQSVSPLISNPNVGMDRAGATATKVEPASFSDIDGLYFANTMAGTSFNTTIQTPSGPVNLIPPSYANSSQTQWIALDYSMQLSISLTQWMNWQAAKANAVPPKSRVMMHELIRNMDEE